MKLNTNNFALSAQRQLSTLTRALARSMERLATGRRVNSAQDDAASLAISDRFQGEIRGSRQVISNLIQARGHLQSADGLLAIQTELIHRMREIAVQSANGTLSSSDRDSLNTEFQALFDEFDRLADHAQFGSSRTLLQNQQIEVQVGTLKGQTIALHMEASTAQGTFFMEQESTTETESSSQIDPPGTTVSSVFTADLDDDGDQDLLATNQPAGSTYIYLNNGDGSFSHTATLTGTGALDAGGALGIADVNGDGNQDVVASGNTYHGLWLGNGDGSFQTVKTFGVDSNGYDFNLEDLDGDGDKDLLMADIISTDLTVSYYLFNSGTGSYGARMTLSAGTYPFAIEVGDFNEDGKVDVVAGHSSEANLSLFFGNGDGTFQTRLTIAIGGNSRSLVSGDFNEDGNLDIINSSTSGNTYHGLFLGNGNGTFQTVQTIMIASENSVRFVPADFNEDGHEDFIVVNTSGTIMKIAGNGDGTFALDETLSISGLQFATVADLNGDGTTDLVYSASNVLNLSIREAGTESTLTYAASLSVDSQENAEDALDVLDGALSLVLDRRSSIGAFMSRLDSVERSTKILEENLVKADESLLGLDLSAEVSELIRLQTLREISTRLTRTINFQAVLMATLLKKD